MMEEYLMKQAAPTLAGVKCGCLFRISLDPDAITKETSRMNSVLNHRGVRIIVLRSSGREHLIYAFRPQMLSDILSDGRIFSFLENRGYDMASLGRTFRSLRERMMHYGMAHEIGIFLGYPLDDVIGFIENKGMNFKATGCWKVYGDVSRAKSMFEKIRSCRAVYTEQYMRGTPISNVVV
jgi:hypothetical protein